MRANIHKKPGNMPGVSFSTDLCLALPGFFYSFKAALRAACFSYSCIILALRLPHSAVSMAKVRGAPPRGQEGLPGLIMYSLPS